jgi:hypothetical protein
VADDEQSRLRDLVVRGTEISTAVIGAAAAAHFLTEDPNAVVSLLVDEAPLFAGTIAWVASDYLDRRLSRRERLRVDTAITFAARKAYQRIMDGDQIRSDEFFQRNPQEERAPSEEIAEAIALAVQREAEERKVRHIGFILGNLAFETSVDRVAANSFVRLAEDLSYTQMQLLALVDRNTEIALPPRMEQTAKRISWKAASVSREFNDLGFSYKELILPKAEQGKGFPENISVPADQRLTPLGEALSALMDLTTIPIEEIEDVVAALWEASGKERPTGS